MLWQLSQSFIKLNSYCDFCYIVMSALSSSFLSFGEFEKADDLLDKLCKLISRVGYDSLQNYEHFTGEAFVYL